MMRSLNSAVAGLRTHQTKMDVIGNNIANVNTYGFKSSRVTFTDIYYQTLNGASSPSNTRGGTNPTQIGYGSAVATVDVLIAQAGGVTTDRALDVYITGDGFLVTTNSRGDYMYTRLGNLGFDADGNLIDPNGNYVMGFPMKYDEDGNYVPDIPATGVANGENIAPINVDPDILDKLTGISIGLNGEIVGLLEGGAKVTLAPAADKLPWVIDASVTEESTMEGSIKMIAGAYIPTGANGIDKIGPLLGAGVNISGIDFGGDLFIDNSEDLEVWVAGGKLHMKGSYVDAKGDTQTFEVSGNYNNNGDIELKDDKGKCLFVVKTDHSGSGTIPDHANNASNPVKILKADLKMGVQLVGVDKGGNKVVEPIVDYNGNAQQQFTINGVTITLDTSAGLGFVGTVATVGSEEATKLQLGNLVLAKFRNAAGLEEIGNSQFIATGNSGEAEYVRPGQEGTGSTKSNMLELSNVDISKEFTDMITTQRGFQANTRIITVSDEMLAELVNLKR